MTLGSGLATHYSVSCIVSVAGIGPAPLAKAVGASGGCRSGLKTWAGGASRDLAWAFRRSSPRKNASTAELMMGPGRWRCIPYRQLGVSCVETLGVRPENRTLFFLP